MAFAVVVEFVLLQLEMQMQTAIAGMIENDTPLIKLAAVIVQLLVAGDKGPDVVAVTACVVREEGDRINSLLAK